ncbi:MAG: type II toxin-antitoxin system HigB family toxin [Phormidesmis sp.]
MYTLDIKSLFLILCRNARNSYIHTKHEKTYIYNIMRIITRGRLLSFAEKHRDAGTALDAWYRLAKSAKWQSFNELKKSVGTADVAGKFTIFNIKGNQYRLIVDIQYQKQIIYIKYVLTHKEYDKDQWKRDPYY